MNASLPATLHALHHPWPESPAPGSAREVAPGVSWLRMPLPFALDHINLWLCADNDGGRVQIDCGYGDARTRALWEHHFASTLEGEPIRRIIATHYHPDHLGNAGVRVRLRQGGRLHALLARRGTPRRRPGRGRALRRLAAASAAVASPSSPLRTSAWSPAMRSRSGRTAGASYPGTVIRPNTLRSIARLWASSSPATCFSRRSAPT